MLGERGYTWRMSIENPFEAIKKEHDAAAEAMPQTGHYALDSHGSPHFAATAEEAVAKAKFANEGYQ